MIPGFSIRRPTATLVRVLLRHAPQMRVVPCQVPPRTAMPSRTHPSCEFCRKILTKSRNIFFFIQNRHKFAFRLGALGWGPGSPFLGASFCTATVLV